MTKEAYKDGIKEALVKIGASRLSKELAALHFSSTPKKIGQKIPNIDMLVRGAEKLRSSQDPREKKGWNWLVNKDQWHNYYDKIRNIREKFSLPKNNNSTIKQRLGAKKAWETKKIKNEEAKLLYAKKDSFNKKLGL